MTGEELDDREENSLQAAQLTGPLSQGLTQSPDSTVSDPVLGQVD